MKAKTKTITVYKVWHNGNNWEHIEGASWTQHMQHGESFEDAILRESTSGCWPAYPDARVKLVARDDDSDTDYIAEDVFSAAELRAGKRL